jgi:hypothetical protein
MSAGAEQSKFKRALEALVKEFKRQSGPNAPTTFQGAVDKTILEHTVRKYFLDKLIDALGWDLSNLNVDIAEEARVKDSTTLFMDYLGVHPTSRTPMLIFEAKAWDKPLITAADRLAASRNGKREPSPAEIVSLALKHCKANEDEKRSPVSIEWREWLLKLIQYVASVKQTSGHEVKCVAISSGQWIVIFRNPAQAFLDVGAPDYQSITVVEIDDYVSNSDCLFESLAREKLLSAPPFYIVPTHIQAHLSTSAAKRLFLGVWLHHSTTGSVFDMHPQILVYPAVVVQRVDEEFVTIVDRSLGHDPIPIDMSEIAQHVRSIRARSERLRTAISDIMPGLPLPSPLAEFPGFNSLSRDGEVKKVYEPKDTGKDFLRSFPSQSGQFILATGDSHHFFVEVPRVRDCDGHEWALCKSLSQHAGDRPIVARSVEPASFFISGELHHCAHRVIHGRREGRCKIRAFETFLCCQACAYQTVCWGAVDDLPCGFRVPTSETAHSRPDAVEEATYSRERGMS